MLTSKQAAALNVIKAFTQEQQRLPTLEEIGNQLGIGRSTVHKHIRSLIAGGYLLESEGKAAYRLRDDFQSEDTLPYMGRIAAGAPIEAIPEQQNINLAKVFCGPDRYVLKISGDSMIEAGIWDEDYVVIQKQSYAREGSIIVALISRYEATLKYYHPKDTGVVELRPANSALDPMYYPSDQVEIQGVLVGVFRDYIGG
ncbi:MAG TPA: repressor LexA [Leucothrix mucor]|nr:repressor LexA [Leucothrix mucor]